MKNKLETLQTEQQLAGLRRPAAAARYCYYNNDICTLLYRTNIILL
jgi:hypothetical protein